MKKFLPLCGLICCMSAAFGQTAPIRDGSWELGGFAGASYGVGEAAVMGGGNLSYAVKAFFLPYVEYSFLPNVERESTGAIGSTNFTAKANYTANVSDFHGGVHLRWKIKDSRWAPYAAFGVGTMHVGDGVIHTLTYTDSNGSHTLTGQTLPVTGGSNVAVNFGGGIRYYKTPLLGFRLEVKGYKPFNGQKLATNFGQPGTVTFNNSFVKFEAGIFLQFGGRTKGVH